MYAVIVLVVVCCAECDRLTCPIEVSNKSDQFHSLLGSLTVCQLNLHSPHIVQHTSAAHLTAARMD